MSEEGLNKGQGQDQEAKTPFFDSSDISNKKDVEHFTNVEGAEERAKAAERAKKAAEAEAREVHEADVRAASEQMKKAEKGEKKGIVNFLFGGWHKIVTIVIAILLLVGGVFLVLKNIPESEEKILARDRAAIGRAQLIYTEAEKTRMSGSYDGAKAKFEEALNGCNREEKIFITIKYAEYIASMERDGKTADSMVKEVESLSRTEIEEEYIRVGRNNIKMHTGGNE